jgi:alpha-methylacyl-CoA racemase
MQEQALAGLKVIELHAIGPVPFAGMILQSLGAQITRVSPPNDPGLGLGLDPRFDVLNTGKTVCKLDLKAAEQRAQLHQLLADADLLLEGFRPGVLERLGLAPLELLNAHPRLVIGRLSGWGDQGELAKRAGHDINYLALSGALAAIGPADHPVAPLNLVADFGGGAMHLLVGVLAQLVQRGITGRGGVVTTSILAGTVGLLPMFYGMLAGGRWRLARSANLLDGGAPFYRAYACADGRHVAVGAIEPKFYRELLELTGLASSLRMDDQYREAAWPQAAAALAAAFARRSRDEWASLAAQRDCCVSPVLDLTEAAAHAHNRANHLFTEHDFTVPDRIIRSETAVTLGQADSRHRPG